MSYLPDLMDAGPVDVLTRLRGGDDSLMTDGHQGLVTFLAPSSPGHEECEERHMTWQWSHVSIFRGRMTTGDLACDCGVADG